MPKLRFALSILVLPITFHSIQAQVTGTKAGTASVSGRVTLKGEPARGVTVILQGQNNPVPATNSPRARADESGRFHFTGVAAGRYSISAIAPGYVTPGDPMIGFRGQTLNLADGDKVENIDLEIKRGGVIAGRVTDSQNRPVIEETITLSRVDRNNRPQNFFAFSSNFDMYRTDDRGFYRIYGLPEGRFLVSAGYAQTMGSVRISMSREFYPRVFYPSAISESEAKVIEVSEGSEATDVDITLPDPKQTHDVYGRVVDAGAGQPVAGVEVMVGGLTADGRPGGGIAGSGARSGPNGEFRLFGVVPGRYAIFARNDDPVGGGYVSDPVTVDIGEGDATGVEVKVRQGASISGVAIIEGTNDPKTLAKLSQVNLMAFIRPTGQVPPTPSMRRPVRVNPDGSFRISGLPRGTINFTMAYPAPKGLALVRVERDGVEQTKSGIEVGSREEISGVKVVFAYGTGSIRGQVKVEDGEIPPGAMMYLSMRRIGIDDRQGMRPVTVDVRGRFAIDGLQPGDYELALNYVTRPATPGAGGQIISKGLKQTVTVTNGVETQVTMIVDSKSSDR